MGNSKQVHAIKAYITSVCAKSSGKRQSAPYILLISGPPGIGKTSAAHVCLAEAGLAVVDTNASDARSSQEITETIGCATVRRVGTGQRCGLVFDEVDGITTSGLSIIIRYWQKGVLAGVPIICIANDPNCTTLRPLRSHIKHIEFQRLTSKDMLKCGVSILKREGKTLTAASQDAVRDVLKKNRGDMRQFLVELQLITGIKVPSEVGCGDVFTSQKTLKGNIDEMLNTASDFNTLERIFMYDPHMMAAAIGSYGGKVCGDDLSAMSSHSSTISASDCLQWRAPIGVVCALNVQSLITNRRTSAMQNFTFPPSLIPPNARGVLRKRIGTDMFDHLRRLMTCDATPADEHSEHVKNAMIKYSISSCEMKLLLPHDDSTSAWHDWVHTCLENEQSDDHHAKKRRCNKRKT